jgi:outer membrane protein assembly factor BamB
MVQGTGATGYRVTRAPAIARDPKGRTDVSATDPKRRHRSRFAPAAAWVSAVTLAALAATAAETDRDGLIATSEPGWPQWRGPRRDGICAETGLLPNWPAEGPPLLWKVGGLGRGYSSPIIARGLLYLTGDVGGELRIFAFTLDGKPKWQSTNGRAWKASYPGARASCAFDGGRLYHMNAHGRVACLDANSGGELWAVNVLERFDGKNIRWGLSECLLVDGPRVIVTPGGRKGLMAALDKASGKTVWASEPMAGERAGYASPILFRWRGRRMLATCSSKHVFGVDADTGRLLWAHPRPTRFEVIASVPVYYDGAIFASSPDGKEAELLRLQADGDTVRVRHVWSSELNNLSGGVILRNGLLYGAGYRKGNGWFGVDARTGKTRYRKRDLASGSAVYADGRLYCLSERGVMALLKPAPAALAAAGQFRLVQRRVRDAWAHPVIHDKRLYLRYHDTLWCYDIRRR